MFGISSEEIVKVKANRLKAVLEENEKVQDLKKENEELRAIIAKQSDTIAWYMNREEELLDINEEQHAELIRKDNKIREQRRVMEEADRRLSKALHKAKKADQLQDSLNMSNALREYRRNQDNIDKLTEPITVNI